MNQTLCNECAIVQQHPPIGWLQVTHDTTAFSIGDDTSDKDFCSWACLARFAIDQDTAA